MRRAQRLVRQWFGTEVVATVLATAAIVGVFGNVAGAASDARMRLSTGGTLNPQVADGAPCLPGTYSATGDAPCIPAPPGSYVSGTGAIEATPCAPGSYQPDSGATSCILAPPGSYVPVFGATAPTPCPGGTYQPNAGATSCLTDPVVTVSPATIPSATVGQLYSQMITGSGGTAPYAFAVTAGALPGSMTLDAAGLLSGTPTEPGSASFTISATDAYGFAGSQPYELTVTAPLAVSTSKLAFGVVGFAYKTTLKATGGSGTDTWSLAAGSLPAGLHLTNNGRISGTPTAATTSDLTVQVADSAGNTATRSMSLTVYTAASDGSGTATITPKTTHGGSSDNVFTIKYKAPASGALDNGTVQIVVPTDWTAPSTTAGDDGFTITSKGTAHVAGQLLTITGLTLAPGQVASFIYGSTAGEATGVTVPATTGKQTFATAEASTPTGTLETLTKSPAVTVI